jgi:hypothetical protein
LTISALLDDEDFIAAIEAELNADVAELASEETEEGSATDDNSAGVFDALVETEESAPPTEEEPSEEPSEGEGVGGALVPDVIQGGIATVEGDDEIASDGGDIEVGDVALLEGAHSELSDESSRDPLDDVSVLLCTVTNYANRAHNLTRSP